MKPLGFFLVVIISFLPLVSLFATPLLPHTHDGLVHLARIGAYFKALQDGQIPVRFAGDLNYGYGLPLFNFIYPLPYTIASLLIFLGFGLVEAFKITLASSFILSGIFMLLFSLEFFRDIKKAILVTLFYQFAPFRLVEVLIRGSFGEVYTYAFLPLILWGLIRLFQTHTFSYVLLTSIGTALLILSHNAISLVFFVIVALFIAFFGSKKRDYVLGFACLFLGLFLSSFYWMPAIIEHKYTYGDLFMRQVYLANFPPFQNFFIPNFLNDLRLQTGGVSVQFGLFHVFVLLLALFTFFYYKKLSFTIKKLIVFCSSCFIVAIFLMQPISKIVWENVSILRQFQFPWRLLAVVVFVASLLSACLLRYKVFNKRLIYALLLFGLIFSTIYYWRPTLGLDKINENYYWNYPFNTTYYGETDVIWSAGPASGYPKQRVEVISGKATVGKIDKKSNKHTFVVDAKTDAQLVSHTQYFPGWRVYVDGVLSPIQFQDPNHRGEIVFLVSKGTHSVRMAFGESKIRFVADMLTVGTVGLLFLIGILGKTIKYKLLLGLVS